MQNNKRSKFRPLDERGVDIEAPRFDQRGATLEESRKRLQGLTSTVKEVGRLVDELETLHTGQLDCVTEEDKRRHNEAVQAHTRKIHDKVTAARNELKLQEQRLYGPLPGEDVSGTTSLQNSFQLLSKALNEAVTKMQQFDNRCKTEQKQAVQEQLHAILGHAPEDHQVDRVLASGDRQAVLAGLMTNRGQDALQSVLTQMEGRLMGVEMLARETYEIMHVMQQMLTMLKQQQSQVEAVGTRVDYADVKVGQGLGQLQGATKLKDKVMKMRMWIISVTVITVLAIAAIVLLVELSKN